MLLLDFEKVTTEIIEVFGVRVYHLLRGTYESISTANDANNKWKYPNE